MSWTIDINKLFIENDINIGNGKIQIENQDSIFNSMNVEEYLNNDIIIKNNFNRNKDHKHIKSNVKKLYFQYYGQYMSFKIHMHLYTPNLRFFVFQQYL